MKGRIRMALALAAVAGLAGLAWTMLGAGYLDPRRTLRDRLASIGADIDRYQGGIRDQPRVAAALRAYADRTLGGVLESVDHELRSRLNRVGEQIGLDDLVVGSGRSRSIPSPARALFPGTAARELREEIDFAELEGWISGQGSLEQVVGLVARLDAEPWLKRIHQVEIDPKQGTDRYGVTLRLTTLYLPGRAPVEPPQEASVAALAPRHALLLARDPFRVRPAATAPAAAEAFPYQAWVLTGVAAGPGGAEAWLLNGATGESRRVAVGGAFEDLVLVAASGEVAEFQAGDRRIAVSVGQPLRAPDE